MTSTKKRLNVLLINKNKEDFIYISDILTQAQEIYFNVTWAQSFTDGLEAIRNHQHDAYLVDCCLDQQHDGVELVREAIKSGCQAPIIMLTQQDNREQTIWLKNIFKLRNLSALSVTPSSTSGFKTSCSNKLLITQKSWPVSRRS